MNRNRLVFALVTLLTVACGGKRYLSPVDVATDRINNIAYTALSDAKAVSVTDLVAEKTVGTISLNSNPNGLLLSPDAERLFVSCGKADGRVAVISLSDRKIIAEIPTGHTPQGMALSADGRTLYVANRFSNNISVIELAQRRVTASIAAVREPRALCLAGNATLAVANCLPAQAANEALVAAQITLIDVPANRVRDNVMLENGAQSVAGICASPDGRFVYATHLLSKYDIPVTQLDRGWVNTNALGIIDLAGDSLYATVLLDEVDGGAANPAGLCFDLRGNLCIAAAGTHELVVFDAKAMHEKLEALFSGKFIDLYIKNRTDLSASLSFATSFKTRVALQGVSPRAVACASNGIVASSYFSPFIEKISDFNKPSTAIMLGKEPSPDAVRRGELAFCDASICYQGWQTCASCHPDARVDGLNWDQQNDGLGNPKNTKSLLFSHVTPPCMITGIRRNAELAVRNGILHTLQTVQPEQLAADIDEYLKHLAPDESPYLTEYHQKDPQERGKALFASTGCLNCHNGQYFTDKHRYNVGTGTGDEVDTPFDTPTLREIWRTAPYLYNGQARSIREVLVDYNKTDRHGITQNLSDDELQALILYILTL
ncbi:MAG: c-type cytochrome [Prevotellaceae bacterium]|nr:c-type cytochrome [Prevotellaceae bacterium]